ncbi:hypothetical protein AQPE_1056 [Aquipluma nitroreducens]|uniref:Uncharacterized protein n=1 Tax=Aquipluma nitroreducens TaxID=2010828 RepID=A0A5K7S5V4_9BACT|nr:hypothetical protein AQPE_1056 [Aquipluma nitroreducens]
MLGRSIKSQNVKSTITNKLNFFDTLVDQITVIVYQHKKE